MYLKLTCFLSLFFLLSRLPLHGHTIKTIIQKKSIYLFIDIWLIPHVFIIINKTAMNIHDEILNVVVFWNLISQLFIFSMETHLIFCFVYFSNLLWLSSTNISVKNVFGSSFGLRKNIILVLPLNLCACNSFFFLDRAGQYLQDNVEKKF